MTEAVSTNCDFDAASFDHCRLERLSAHGALFAAAWIIETVVTYATAVDGSLRRSTAIGADFTGADLSRIDAAGMSASNCSMVDAVLVGADLRGATFGSCRLDGARLMDARLERTAFVDCDLSQIRTDGVDTSGVILAGSSTWPERRL